MGLSAEEILARIGLDQTGMDVGMRQMLAKQEAYGKEYTATWNKILSDRDAAETAANDRSLAKLKALDDAKLAETERFFAAQKAMYEEQAAVSSLGSNAQYERDAAGNLMPSGGWGTVKKVEQAEAAAKAAKEAEGAAKELHGGSTIVRETAVLFREGIRGNFTRMLGSATILVQALGALLVVAGAIGAAIGTGVNVLAGGKVSDWWSWWGAKKDAAQGQKDLEQSEKIESGNLEERIASLHKAGLIDDKQATDFRDQLKRGDVMGVLGATNKFAPQLDALKKNKAASDRDKSLFESAQEIRKPLSPEERLKYDKEIQAQLFNQHLAGADVSKEIKKNWDEIADDQKQITEQAKKQKEHEEEKTAETKKQVDNLRQSAANEMTAYNRHLQEQDMPTLADLAGRKYNSRLGRWKKFNLGTGSGPFAGIAQDAERSQAMVQWNIEQGNAQFDDQGNLTGGDAFGWMQRQKRDIGQLRAAGLRDDKFDQMNEHLSTINQKLAKLGVTIVGVNDGQ